MVCSCLFLGYIYHSYSFQVTGKRTSWDIEERNMLFKGLEEYLKQLMVTGRLPKVAEVSRILFQKNLNWIMSKNGRQRTMEKVRLELKNLKREKEETNKSNAEQE